MSDAVEDNAAEANQDTNDAPKAKDFLEADLHEARQKKNEAVARAEAAEKELKKLQRANLSEMEKLRAEFEDIKREKETLISELTNYKTNTLKTSIVSEFNLNAKYAKFLVGSNEDELRESAKELAELQGSAAKDDNPKDSVISGNAKKARTAKQGDKPKGFNDALRDAWNRSMQGEKSIDFN